MNKLKEPLVKSGQDWTSDLIDDVYLLLERIATEKYGLSIYPNQIEIISSEQMLDAYAAHALPIIYPHWSFGKKFVRQQELYRQGYMGLAYEVVINCLTEGTHVFTDQGIIPIEQITVNDKVWNGIDFIDVTHIKKDTAVEHKCFTLADGNKITSTPNHRFPVISQEGYKIKTATDLTSDDYLLIPNNTLNNINDITFEAFEKEYMPTLNGFGGKFAFHHYCQIPPKMTPELAELMGIIIGDGAIGHTHSTSFYIIIGYPDVGYENHVINLIKSIFDVNPVIRNLESKKYPGRFNTIIQVFGREIKEFLHFCGLRKNFTHKNKRIPWSVKQSTLGCRAAFLRGLFDTDGFVSTKKQKMIGFSCYNYELGCDTSLLLNSIGIKNRIDSINNNYQKINRISIISEGRLIFKDIVGSSITRKQHALESFTYSPYNSDSSSISETPEYYTIKYNQPKMGISHFLKKTEVSVEDLQILTNYRPIRIINIENKTTSVNVFDLTVNSKDHLFVANNILTHNSSPCISYNMEENTMMMMTLVMAHAAMGHNAFFKNNYAFKQWTDAEGIIDYLVFAKKYITTQEEMHGYSAVEEVLDACHALFEYGINRYKKPRKLSAEQEKARATEREEYIQKQLNVLWSTIPQTKIDRNVDNKPTFPSSPEENILYFLEKNAPRLEQWEREIIRIVRKLSQYFYPNILTNNMNEGFACWTHYKLIHDLYEMNAVDTGAMLEFYKAHTGVCFQPDIDDPRYSGINPYSLFFEIFRDIERICIDPTDEDRKWFSWAGNNEPYETVKFAMENFKDDSFVLQYLSPKVTRDFHLFNVFDDERDPMVEITAIHNDEGFKQLREHLSNQRSFSYNIPDIQVYNVDQWGDRSLTLKHIMVNNRPLEPKTATQVLKHVERLWKYPVHLQSVDGQNRQRASFSTNGKETLLDIFLEDE